MIAGSKESQQFLLSLAVKIINQLTYTYLNKLKNYIEDVIQHVDKETE